MNLDFTKRDIKLIPFDKLSEDNDILAALLEAMKVHYTWIIPSAQMLINKTLTLSRSNEGLISPRDTLAQFADTVTKDELKWFKHLLLYLNTVPRGNILGVSQNKCASMSALVPLILASFKMFRGVNYSEWDWKDPYMKALVDKDLYEAVTIGTELKPTREELIEAREYSCTVKSGKRIGTKTAYTSQFSVSNKSFSNPDYNLLPRLRKIMDTQIWVAHPSLRTSYMILDVNNLDSMPEPFDTLVVKEKVDDSLDWKF
jgi:hypothetical protein